jgi:hypothetical protein
MPSLDPIGIAKAMLWEEAKGKIRAMVAVNGQCPCTDEHRVKQSKDAEKVSEAFFKKFEDHGLHE